MENESDAPLGPGALWGLAQVRAYTGVGKEKARTWWQATRRRAADPAAAAAADALPVPAFLLAEGEGTAGFFSVHGDRHVRDWWTIPKVRPLWRPETIALWAAITGRAVRAGGALSEEYRLPVPMWVDLPPLPALLPRATDELVRLDRPGYTPSDLHVRIFDGPLPADQTDAFTHPDGRGGARKTHTPGIARIPRDPGGAVQAHRTVVVLAMPDGATLPPTVWAEEIAAHLMATGRLSTEQARRAFWFALLSTTRPSLNEDNRLIVLPKAYYLGFAITDADALADAPALVRQRHRLTAALDRRADRPSGGPLSDPRVERADLEDIDALIGRRLEIYPRSSYTADTVARFTAHERPVQVPWDPEQLAADLEHLPVLHAAVQDAAVQDAAAGEQPPARAEAAGETAARKAALPGAALRVARDWVAAHAHHLLTGGYLDPVGTSERDAVIRVMPVPTDADRALVTRLVAHEEPYLYPMAVRDLLAVRAAHDHAAETGQSPALTAALAHAADRIALHHRQQIGGHAQLQQWIPARVDAPGPAPLPLPAPDASADAGIEAAPDAAPDAAAYLATVSWWGPSADDGEHAGLLAALFYRHELDAGTRHGYDPFGRLVLWCPHAHAFGVAWPVTDHTADLQNPQHRFTALDDGRVDLVPLAGPASDDESVDNAGGDTTLPQSAR
ncbi:hypothetical protein [Actinomadura opuntiae]|uniref:hypothetical protein n=1 Tax=Actinomadura sp. OS1-43 TaxID=604315 RepID=UPI00255B01E1|nr:hypothetical protein [Actinomadura sp. OS1-43]MDL4813138.1 hypothetical protein [Actinomadura sp. OS1-43]